MRDSKRSKTKRKKISASKAAYPAPREAGGRLLRTLVARFRALGIALPIDSHILCACSAGADSTALAVALARYGRRIGKRSGLVLLHVNHGWRGAESDADEAFVRELAGSLGVGFVARRLESRPRPGDSWEAHARAGRKEIFRQESRAHGDAVVLTAHTADDQAETRLWRILTGAYERLGSGILSRHEVEIRPLLAVRKSLLRDFLREEDQAWREDSSNQDPRFLRARMRRDLMPVVEALFPGAIEALNALEPGRSSE